MEELVRTEMPAHILARICWIGDRPVDQPENENDMIQFEKHYKAFLLSKTNVGQGQNSNKLKALIKILGNLNSIYPEGRLIDCDDESDTIAGRVVLGSTRLGKL
jgi:hypothetical protein